VDHNLPPNPPPPGPPPPGDPFGRPPTDPAFNRPADYYSQSAPPPDQQQRRGCPKWIPITCGLLGCLGLILIFVGGGMLARGGFPRLTLWMTERLEGEVRGLMQPDVTQEQRAEFDRQFDILKQRIRNREATLVELQGPLNVINEAIRDREVDSADMERINESLRRANEGITVDPEPTQLRLIPWEDPAPRPA
jgi:hypothetical protein